MDPELDQDWFWPKSPPARGTPRVIPALFGAYHAVRHRLDGAAREHGLDATEALVIDAVRREPRCAPWAIRRRLGFTRSTLGSILDRLEAEERIVRRASGFRGQRFEIDLGPAGRSAADVAQYLIDRLEEEIAGYASPGERRGAIAVFEAGMAIDRSDRPHP
jgi:DNA-binding MarR family transcriptional regulator